MRAHTLQSFSTVQTPGKGAVQCMQQLRSSCTWWADPWDVVRLIDACLPWNQQLGMAM